MIGQKVQSRLKLSVTSACFIDMLGKSNVELQRVIFSCLLLEGAYRDSGPRWILPMVSYTSYVEGYMCSDLNFDNFL